MQCLDQAPPEIQKNLFRALIENIVVYEEKVEMNLCVQPETMPEAFKLPQKDETPTPTNQDEGLSRQKEPVVASAASSSYWRPLKGRWLKKVRTPLNWLFKGGLGPEGPNHCLMR